MSSTFISQLHKKYSDIIIFSTDFVIQLQGSFILLFGKFTYSNYYYFNSNTKTISSQFSTVEF